MLKIRLLRIGAKKKPFYRVVAVDERAKRTGTYIELLGTYNPLTDPKEIKLKQDRIDEWVKKGAQLSDGYLRMIGKAPQRPPRKPKKEKKAAPAAQPTQQPDEAAKVTTEEAAPAAEEAVTPAETVEPVEQAPAETPTEEATATPEEPATEEAPATDTEPVAGPAAEAEETKDEGSA